MAQHDYVIDNQSFPATRTDINNVLLAISSTNSGTSAPSTTYANQLWYDTTNNKLYIRNEDNDAWIPLFLLDQSNDVAGTLATEIDVEDSSGTDTSGTSLTIKGGAGTGSGAGGAIIFQTADGGASGSSVNAHATRVTITDDGLVGIATTSPSNATLDVAGRARFLQDAAATTGAIILRESSGGVGGHIQFVNNDNSAQRGFIASNSSGDILLGGAAERLRMLSAGGLTFNGDTAAANALDDYEEGTFTPVFSRGGTAFSTTPTYSTQDGSYVKIGSLVHAEIEIRFNNSFSGGSGNYLVQNLPFSNSGVANLEGISWGLMTVFNHTWSFANTFAYLSGTDVNFGSGMGLASNTNEQYLTFTIQYRVA